MNEVVEMKTAELNGAALDWMVAEATGQAKTILRGKAYALFGSLALPFNDPEKGYAPSSCWHCGGPLLETQYIELSIGDEEYWARRTCTSKYDEDRVSYPGSSMLIAACRAIVGEKLGQVVSVPKELLPC